MIWIFMAVLVLLLAAYLVWQNSAFIVDEYTVESPALPEALDGCTIVHFSDLHNRGFGNDQQRLIAELDQIRPDMIVITGDLIDKRRTKADAWDNALSLVRQAAEYAPVFYVSGNHEWESGYYAKLRQQLETLGVEILDDGFTVLDHGDASIVMMGLSDPAAFSKSVKAGGMMKQAELFACSKKMEERLTWISEQSERDDSFRILLAHRPQYLRMYARAGVHLVFCGHAHGGQIRLPKIGGLYSPDQGIRPQYTEGPYIKGDTVMVVSRGLGNSSFPFRVCNRPQVLVANLRSSKAVEREEAEEEVKRLQEERLRQEANLAARIDEPIPEDVEALPVVEKQAILSSAVAEDNSAEDSSLKKVKEQAEALQQEQAAEALRQEQMAEALRQEQAAEAKRLEQEAEALRQEQAAEALRLEQEALRQEQEAEALRREQAKEAALKAAAQSWSSLEQEEETEVPEGSALILEDDFVAFDDLSVELSGGFVEAFANKYEDHDSLSEDDWKEEADPAEGVDDSPRTLSVSEDAIDEAAFSINEDFTIQPPILDFQVPEPEVASSQSDTETFDAIASEILENELFQSKKPAISAEPELTAQLTPAVEEEPFSLEMLEPFNFTIPELEQEETISTPEPEHPNLPFEELEFNFSIPELEPSTDTLEKPEEVAFTMPEPEKSEELAFAVPELEESEELAFAMPELEESEEVAFTMPEPEESEEVALMMPEPEESEELAFAMLELEESEEVAFTMPEPEKPEELAFEKSELNEPDVLDFAVPEPEQPQEFNSIPEPEVPIMVPKNSEELDFSMSELEIEALTTSQEDVMSLPDDFNFIMPALDDDDEPALTPDELLSPLEAPQAFDFTMPEMETDTVPIVLEKPKGFRFTAPVLEEEEPPIMPEELTTLRAEPEAFDFAMPELEETLPVSTPKKAKPPLEEPKAFRFAVPDLDDEEPPITPEELVYSPNEFGTEMDVSSKEVPFGTDEEQVFSLENLTSIKKSNSQKTATDFESEEALFNSLKSLL